MTLTILLICLTAFGASLLTFFSGFGLGTILLPVMAVFFPVELAVALTAIVHFLNNVFKLVLVGRHARWMVVLQFGLPAILAAYLGAQFLFVLPHAKQVVAALMIIFALVELLPRFKKIQLGARWMPLGGVLSGFFGGLTGHQGALRSMFLIRTGLSKEAFIATGVVIACVVDTMRLSVYATRFSWQDLAPQSTVLIAASASAFVGALFGNQLLKKMTIDILQIGVAMMVAVLAILLMAGIL